MIDQAADVGGLPEEKNLPERMQSTVTSGIPGKMVAQEEEVNFLLFISLNFISGDQSFV